MGLHPYPPLKSTTDVRIFALEPAEGEAPVKGKVVEFTIEEVKTGAIQYEAISYVWGDASDKVPLDCSDGFVDIPRNLSNALRYIRRRDAVCYVWADSISINQKDTLEKSQEVRRMFTIFGQAKRVIMWLGEVTPGTLQGVSSFRALCESVLSNPESEAYREVYETMQSTVSRGTFLTIRSELKASGNINWASLAALFCLPYFTRLWVLQEAIAPRIATLKLGHDELDWQLVRDAAPVLITKFWGLGKVFRAVSDNLTLRHNLRNLLLMAVGIGKSSLLRLQPSETNNLLSILVCTASLSTTEPVDALFAILHLTAGVSLESDKDHELLPDYNASPGEVFHRLAIWLIVKHQQYDYLAFVKGSSDMNSVEVFHKGDNQMANHQTLWQDQKIPSWVPLRLHRHLCTGYYYQQAAIGSKKRRVRPAKAGGDLSVLQTPELSPDKNVLGLLGKMVDKIDALPTKQVSDFIRDETALPLSIYSDIVLGDNAADYFVTSLKEICGESWRDTFKSEAMCHLIQYAAVLKDAVSMKTLYTVDDLSEDEKLKCGVQYIAYLEEAFGSSGALNSDGSSKSNLSIDNKFETLSRLLIEFAGRRKICMTKAGRLGWVPWETEPTDVVCVMNQVCVPLVLRPNADGKTFTIVGECFIDSIMNGEALAWETIPTERIFLS